jgi:hypothetical protein
MHQILLGKCGTSVIRALLLRWDILEIGDGVGENLVCTRRVSALTGFVAQST